MPVEGPYKSGPLQVLGAIVATDALSSDIADPGLAVRGSGPDRVGSRPDAGARLDPGALRPRSARSTGIKVAACLHVTAETANLMAALTAGGAEPALCSANPLTTQDEVAAALVAAGVPVQARRGEDAAAYAEHVAALADWGPDVTLDDGADLLVLLHERGDADGLRGGAEETTTGLLRLRRLEAEGRLACPVLAVNESRTERKFNDRHGTGQSALDGILRATNLLLAGRSLVLLGYGATGRGHHPARPRRRRRGDRLRGGSGEGARGAHGRLRGDAGARGRRARRAVRDGHRLARACSAASTSSG